MAEITFTIPDDLIVLKGVAIFTGWSEDGKPQMYASHLPDTHEWDRAMLFREGLRRADTRMQAMWNRADG